MADTQLVIELDITDARKAAEEFQQGMTKVGKSATEAGEAMKATAPAVDQLASKMAELKGPPPAAVDATQKLSDAMGKLAGGPIQMVADKFKEVAGISFETVVASAGVLLNVIKNIGIGIAAISFLGIIEAFKGLGAAMEAVGAKMLTILTRFAALAAVAAVLAPLALIAKAFMQAKTEADAFEKSLHVSTQAIDAFHPGASKMAEELEKQAEGFGLTKDKAQLVSKAYLDLGQGLDAYGMAVDRDIAKHEKMRDQLKGVYDQIVTLIVGYEKMRETNGGLTAAQKNEENALKAQLQAVGQLLDKENQWVTVMKGTVTGHEQAAAAARGEQAAITQVTEALGRGGPAAKAFVDGLNAAQKTGFEKWLSSAKTGLDDTGKSLFDSSRSWLGYREAAKGAGDAVKQTSDSLFANQDRLAKENEGLKNVDAATRKLVEGYRAERDAQRDTVSAAKEKLAQLTNESSMYGGIAGKLQERNKELQESLTIESGAANASQSLISAYKNEMAANDANIQALYKKIDATNAEHNALARSAGQIEVTLASTKNLAAATIAANQATETGKDSWANYFSKMVAGSQTLDVVSKSGEKLGTVTRDTDGKIISTTTSLTKYQDEMRAAGIATAGATDKMTAQQKAAAEQAQKIQAIIAPMKLVSDTTTIAGKSMDATAKSFDTFAVTSNKTASSMNTIALDVKQFEQSASLLPGTLKAANDQMPLFAATLDKLKPPLADLPERLTKTSDSFTAMATSLPTVAAQLTPVAEGFEKLAGKVEIMGTIGAAVAKLGDNLKTMNDSEVLVLDATQKLGEATDKLATSESSLLDIFSKQIDLMAQDTAAAIKLTDAYIALAAAAKAAKDAQGGGSNDQSGGTVQQQKSGGYVGQSVDPLVKLPSMDVFKHAPHFAQGGIVGGSGAVPIIAHKNEAVVPLSGGREIPVTITGNSDSALVPSVTILTKAMDNLGDKIDGSGGLATGLSPPPKLVDGPSQRALHGSNPSKAHPLWHVARDMSGDLIDQSGGSGGDGAPAAPVKPPSPVVNITTHMHGGRFDNFKLTEDQINASVKKAWDKAKMQGTTRG